MVFDAKLRKNGGSQKKDLRQKLETFFFNRCYNFSHGCQFPMMGVACNQWFFHGVRYVCFSQFALFRKKNLKQS